MSASADPPLRTVASDLLALLAVPALLVAIHVLLPASTRASLALDHADPVGYTFVTAAFVHVGDAHLLGNVVGYLLAVVYAYVLCLFANERRWFWTTTVALLLVLPWLTNLLSHLALTAYFGANLPPERGFSGVAAGFGGFLLVALVVFLWRRRNRTLAATMGLGTVLGLLLVLDVTYAGTVEPLVGGLVLFGVGVLGVGYVRERGFPDEFDRRALVSDGALSALVVAVLGYMVVGLFPAAVVAGGVFRNVFAHGIGFVLGVGITGIRLPPIGGP